jgi:Putative zinc-finger
MTVDHACTTHRDDLAELALGTLTGRERAALLTHLEQCDGCAAELDGLAAAGDALLLLVPDETPPVGFAERTVARFGDPARTATAVRGRRRRTWAVAAMILAVAVGVGVGAIAWNAGRSQPTGSERAALVSSDGAHGTAIVTSGAHGQLWVSLADSPIASVTCTVTYADGSHKVVGTYPLSDGYADWALPLPSETSAIRSLRISGPSGTTVATASFQT